MPPTHHAGGQLNTVVSCSQRTWGGRPVEILRATPTKVVKEKGKEKKLDPKSEIPTHEAPTEAERRQAEFQSKIHATISDARSVFRTTEPQESADLELFVTCRDWYLFVISNLKAEKADQLAWSGIVLSELEAEHDIGYMAEQFGLSNDLQTKLFSHGRVVVDQRVFRESKIPKSFWDSAQDLHVRLTDFEFSYEEMRATLHESESKPQILKLLRANGTRGPPYALEWEDGLYFTLSGTLRPQEVLKRLADKRVLPERMKILSLVRDTAVEQELEKEDLKSTQEVLSENSEAALNAILAKNKGNLLVVLGHIEDGSFVVQQPGLPTFRIELYRLQKLAGQAECEVVCLGCSSAMSGAVVGFDRPINPLDALAMLRNAFQQPNYLEFVKCFKVGEAKLVLSGTAFTDVKGDRIQQVHFSQVEGDQRSPSIFLRISTNSMPAIGWLLPQRRYTEIPFYDKGSSSRPPMTPTQPLSRTDLLLVVGVIGGSLAPIAVVAFAAIKLFTLPKRRGSALDRGKTRIS